MANEKVVTLEQLNTVKTYIDTRDGASIKSVSYANNTLTFYTTADQTGEAVATCNLPEEMYLDQTKTAIVDNFAWSATAYPGSTDPSLEGKAVLVMAVKDDDGTNYSFISLSSVIQAVTGTSTNTATSSVTNGTVSVNVKISADNGNVLESKTDGLYVPTPSTAADISNEEGNIIEQKADGLYATVTNITYATNAEVTALFT